MRNAGWGMLAVAGFYLGAGSAAGGPAETVPSAKEVRRAFGEQDLAAFRNPSKVYRPETWFHFIGGNVATNGITADLEALAAAGLSGVQLFHGQFGGPWPGVEPQIKCLSGKWDEAVAHVARECRRLGLRFTMQNCPGWAMAGGPWIAPSNAMRHLVWSRAEIEGGRVVEQALALPQPSREAWRDYRDVAVVAFPVPEGDTGEALVPASVKSSRPDQPWEKCLKGEKDGKVRLSESASTDWVEVTFDEPVTLRTITFPSVQAFNHGWCYLPGITVSVQALRPEGPEEICRYAVPASTWQENQPISLACSDAVSKAYRITLEHKHDMSFASLRLFTAARKNNWESEAAFVLRNLMREPDPRQTRSAWVDPGRVVVLTDKMDADGTLRWAAPQGRWAVLRWGHVNTGKRNGPAPAEATGWECDKLSPQGAEAHFAGYIGRLAGSRKGPLARGLLQGMLLDSWECEAQTWTPGLDAVFLGRRGYALEPWFPALAGYVMGDPETTTRFLRDWRSLINDRLVACFFGRMAELARENGLSIAYETASGDVFPGDILEYYKHADVPMCEFWQPRSEAFVGSLDFKPVKPCASAARLYGKPRVAAEAFTSLALTWDERLAALKEVADIHFAEGVTHLVFHTYTHNPRTDWLPPGTSFGAGIGTPFLRGQTWWRHLPAFSDYLARCGYLLERGRPVSDVLWYLGDEQDGKPPQESPFPKGYAYDYCNPDVLLHRLAVRDGRIVTPEGLSYRALWMPDCRRMLPETLEKILALVRKGAVVIGGRPKGLATLSGGAKAQGRFDAAVAALWDGADGGRVGRGRVLAGVPLDAALAVLGVEPDLRGEGVRWCHRQTKRADWYFVAAQGENGFRGVLDFRCAGKVEVWDPVTGQVADGNVEACSDGRSRVALELAQAGSCFVVIRRDVASRNTAARKPPMREFPVSGPWTLFFPVGWDAPATVRLESLKPWKDLDLPAAARAFSGTAAYTAEFTIEAGDTNGCSELDLGRVEGTASVRLNGEPAGIVWTPPFRVDVSRVVKPGVNRLTVDVTGTWFNRLVYDAGLPEAERKTWTIKGPDKGAGLRPSGLLGPVVLRISR